MHWSASFIGLPWRDRGAARDGVACWGLAVLVYGEHLGLPIPDYAADIVSTEERAQVAAAFSGGTGTGPWIAVDPAEAREFDILVFRRAGLDAHVGIVTEPGRMLHITAGQDSAIVDYTAGRWAPRLSAVYRHRKLRYRQNIEAFVTTLLNLSGHPVTVREIEDGRGKRRTEIVIA
jgi:cell wall-associated NlpC family hydrolase